MLDQKNRPFDFYRKAGIFFNTLSKAQGTKPEQRLPLIIKTGAERYLRLAQNRFMRSHAASSASVEVA